MIFWLNPFWLNPLLLVFLPFSACALTVVNHVDPRGTPEVITTIAASDGSAGVKEFDGKKLESTTKAGLDFEVEGVMLLEELNKPLVPFFAMSLHAGAAEC